MFVKYQFSLCNKGFPREHLVLNSADSISRTIQTIISTQPQQHDTIEYFHIVYLCWNHSQHYIPYRTRFCNIQFYDEKKTKEKNMVKPNRYAFMDNLPMVWIGFYWLPLFSRYLGLWNATLGTFNIIHQLCIYRTDYSFLFHSSSISFFFSIHSLRADPLTDLM